MESRQNDAEWHSEWNKAVSEDWKLIDEKHNLIFSYVYTHLSPNAIKERMPLSRMSCRP